MNAKMMFVFAAVLVVSINHASECRAEFLNVLGVKKINGVPQETSTNPPRYIVEVGYLFNGNLGWPQDQITYAKSATQLCDQEGHKVPGEGTSWPEHRHILKDPVFPTYTQGGVPSITEDECRMFWDVRFRPDAYQCQLDPISYMFSDSGGDYNSDSDDVSFEYNCHGYAFGADGFYGLYTWFTDGANGSQYMLDTWYQATTSGGTKPEPLTRSLMSMPNHISVVNDTWSSNKDYRALSVSFKEGPSPVYVYYYDDGRSHSQLWGGMQSWPIEGGQQIRPTYVKKN